MLGTYILNPSAAFPDDDTSTLESLLYFLSNETKLTHKHTPHIEHSYAFAEKAHRGQFRNTGERYIEHPLRMSGYVAYIHRMLDPGMLTPILQATLNHDVPEDTLYSIADIEREMGFIPAALVHAVTKYKGDEKLSKWKIIRRALSVPYAAGIVVADGHDNLRTIDGLSPERQGSYRRDIWTTTIPIGFGGGYFSETISLMKMAYV